MDDWLEIARREAGITSGSRINNLTLITTSYNPATHAIKGIIQPHGVATGWIPIGINGAGPNFGHVIGPKAGDPMKLDGDQFEISFVNGDPNTPTARHRLSSSADTPPTVKTGEIAIVSQFNHNILMKADGSTTVNTNDKDVAGQNKNSNPLLAHSATTVDKNNNKTINHQTRLDPVAKKLTLLSTDGTNTHSTVHDLNAQTLTHSSVTGAAAGMPADPVAPSLPKGLPNLPSVPGLSGGSMNFQHIFDLLGGKLSHLGTKGGLNIKHIFDMIGGKLTHSATNGSVTHSHIFDTVANTLTHSTTGGSGSHSIVFDAINGIIHSSTAAHSRTAGSTITDAATQILHNGPTKVNSTLNVSQLASFAGGLGTGAFEVAPDSAGGLCQATMGLEVTGGLTVTDVIKLPVYTIAGLATITAPPIGAMVYVSDTVSNAAAAFNGIPTIGGATAVHRPVTFDGTQWRY